MTQSAKLALPVPSSASSVTASSVGAFDQKRSLDNGGVNCDNDVEDAEFTLGAGSEEHVCGRHFLRTGKTLGQPRSVMQDTSGNVINNFGTSTVDMKLGGPGDEAKRRIVLEVGAVSQNKFFPMGKMIGTGSYRLVLDADGTGWFASLHKDECEGPKRQLTVVRAYFENTEECRHPDCQGQPADNMGGYERVFASKLPPSHPPGLQRVPQGLGWWTSRY